MGVCSYQTVDLGTAELMQPTYMQMAAILEPFVDLFLCETLSSKAETMAAASAASMSGQFCAGQLLLIRRPYTHAPVFTAAAQQVTKAACTN